MTCQTYVILETGQTRSPRSEPCLVVVWYLSKSFNIAQSFPMCQFVFVPLAKYTKACHGHTWTEGCYIQNKIFVELKARVIISLFYVTVIIWVCPDPDAGLANLC